MLRTLIGFCALFSSFSVFSSVIINSTRVIYPENAGFINVQLVNQSTSTHLVQAWIDDGDPAKSPEKIRVPFSLTPAVAKVEANAGQALRLAKQDTSALPKDRESVYWLNVLDVPPIPAGEAGTNYLQVALRSRIKLFYRPEGLNGGEKIIDSQLSVKKDGTRACINNASAYYVTVVNIAPFHGENLKAPFTSSLLNETAFIAPFSCHPLDKSPGNAGKFRLSRIDDFGSHRFVMTGE